ncbi:MAG: hypothetical protein FWF43_04350, partial [Propionibacteriaceae bacterium]|nr:hypothetical protein [Propionibacteriaceae bacterium]
MSDTLLRHRFGWARDPAAHLPWSEGPRRFTATMTDKKYVYDFLEGDASMRNLLGGKGANV